MDIIYKVFTGIMSAVILASAGHAFIISFSTEISVNNYFEAVTQTIAESDYNEAVVEKCMDEAASYGYELTVQIYGADAFGVKKYADVKLVYTSRIGMFDITLSKVKQKVV